ncbi:MAG: hypothetical protein R3C18_00260 [Planctomycetaceae bacterium]
MNIPQSLRSYFADATLRVLSYDSETSDLCIHVEKDVGPEFGIIRFSGVSFLSISVFFTGDGIDSIAVRDADGSFWSHSSCIPDSVEDAQAIYRIYDQDGLTHFVVADSIEYEIETVSEGQPS